jgi:glycine oxidase
MSHFDVAIVGNGILGMSTAYSLMIEDPNLKIAIIGPAFREGGATVAAGAMLNCFSEINKHTLKSKYTRSKFELARQSLKMWPTWLKIINTGLSPNHHVTHTPGTFVLLNSRAGKRESDNYLAIRDALKNNHERFEEVEPSEIPGINPVDDSRPLRALYLPEEGVVDPHRVLAALEIMLLRNANVDFVDDTAIEIILDKNKVVGIKTKMGETIRAPRVLLAAGAFSQPLIDRIPLIANRIPKVFSGPGCAVTLKMNDHQFQHAVRTPLRSGSCGIHILPDGKSAHTLYLGASSAVRFSPKDKAKARDAYYLLEHGMEQFNQDLRDAEIVTWKVGNRPITLDTFPLIGKTSVAGLWILTGTGRDGFLCSPLFGMSMAKEILGKSPLFRHEFQPERLPIETMSKAEVIEELADQYISVGYEHAMKLPKLCWSSDIKQMTFQYIKSRYDSLEVETGLAPDIFTMLHYVPEMIPVFKDYYKRIMAEHASPLPLAKVVGYH